MEVRLYVDDFKNQWTIEDAIKLRGFIHSSRFSGDPVTAFNVGYELDDRRSLWILGGRESMDRYLRANSGCTVAAKAG